MDEVCVTACDLVSDILTIDYATSDPQAKINLESNFAAKLPKYLSILEDLLATQATLSQANHQESTSASPESEEKTADKKVIFFVGGKLSAAEIAIFNLFDAWKIRGVPVISSEECLAKYPLLFANVGHSRRLFAEYLTERERLGRASKF